MLPVQTLTTFVPSALPSLTLLALGHEMHAGFDHTTQLKLQGCNHTLCQECAEHLLEYMGSAPLPCPYCRNPIQGFLCQPTHY
jgi:hypothetical protein